MKRLTRWFLVVTVLSTAVVTLPRQLVVADPYPLLFDDTFDDVTLPPGWNVQPGRGDYSLTDEPGYLRYHIDAQHVDPWYDGWARPVLLIRPFSGEKWVMTSRIVYNLRPGTPTNNRTFHFWVREPDDYYTSIRTIRSVGVYDSNPWSNGYGLNAFEPGNEAAALHYFDNSPDPLPADTIFVKIERDGDHFLLGASWDGDDTTLELELDYTFSPGVFGNDQEIVLCGGGWYGAPGGYVDVDFVRVLLDTAVTSVTVQNASPQISSLSAPIDPQNLNDQPVSVEAAFSDPGAADTHDVTWDWGDGNLTQAAAVSPVSEHHSYADPGVYRLQVTITDDDGGLDSQTQEFIVIYDPDGGFVTGGGWISSPEGAYVTDTSLTGKASFGFISKYKKGATVPTGETEFQFRMADLNFHSESYDWLVMAGPKAMYNGVGTINGSGDYGFMISAIDEKLTPSADVDLFRIKIWDKDNGDATVYDNQLGDADDADPTTAIGGGSIVIHKE